MWVTHVRPPSTSLQTTAYLATLGSTKITVDYKLHVHVHTLLYKFSLLYNIHVHDNCMYMTLCIQHVHVHVHVLYIVHACTHAFSTCMYACFQ